MTKYYEAEVKKQSKKQRPKVLSARLTRVLNLLTTLITKRLCNAKEHVAKSEEIMQKTTMR